MNIEWFSRYGDIPGISYETPTGINVAKVRGAGQRPTVITVGGGEKRLSWDTEDGSSSQGPAAARAFDTDLAGKSSKALEKHLAETLELPGQPKDYHFAIQFIVEELWKRRRQEPEVLAAVEKLCWLDVELVRTRPDAITNEYGDDPRFYRATTLDRLLTLYEREGALVEALEIADVAVRFEQLQDRRDAIAERLAAFDEEGVP